jgi:hypothetical protein
MILRVDMHDPRTTASSMTRRSWDQLHIVALCSQRTAKDVRPRTGFHPNQGSLQVRGEGNRLLLRDFFFSSTLPLSPSATR